MSKGNRNLLPRHPDLTTGHLTPSLVSLVSSLESHFLSFSFTIRYILYTVVPVSYTRTPEQYYSSLVTEGKVSPLDLTKIRCLYGV